MSSDRALVERLWWSDDALAVLARTALAPLAGVYGAVMATRSALYDRGVLRARPLALPALAVGNLSVGGTGKTPVSAWLAARLAAAGAHPAIVLRGYGEDEPLVHRTLNPAVPVLTDPDRVQGASRAAALGADVVVLDDAFQHRRAARVADVVLVSADQWPRRWRLLPAGPMREPLGALARATVVMVTRKAASAEQAARVAQALAGAAPRVPVAVLHLAPGEARDAAGGVHDLAALAGTAPLAVTSIADPRAFQAQLAQAGIAARLAAFADHHDFTEAEVARLARDGQGGPAVLCTLKDHVKLAPLWPRGAVPLLYVTQRAALESGHGAVDAALASVLAARTPPTQPARSAESHGQRPSPAD
jgi:tetraacyldisaccharide 4'-kinase